jgi:hypothetical protein
MGAGQSTCNHTQSSKQTAKPSLLNNFEGDFQGHVIRVYNPFVVTNLLCLYSHHKKITAAHLLIIQYSNYLITV